jgi:MarR family transcriptional regulator, organic hydroperoxide resistance regulator
MENKQLFAFDKPEENPGYLLWQVSMLWQLHMKKGLDKVDLTLTQFVLLAALHWLTRSETAIVTQKDLAAHAKTDKMTTSKVLRTLQNKGLLHRGEHERDARAKTLQLSEKGRAVLQKAIGEVEKTDRAFFEKIGQKTPEYQALMLQLFLENQ